MKKTNKLCQRVTSKFNNLNFNYIKKFKYFLAASIFIILLASLIFGFLGANTNVNYGKYYEFKVEFNTELTEKELNSYKDDIISSIKSSEFKKYDVIKQGQQYTNSLAVRLSIGRNANLATLQTKADDLKEDVEALFAEDFDFLSVTDVQQIDGVLTASFIFKSILPLLILIVIFALYLLIRFDANIMLSGLIGMVLDAFLVTSLLILFRIPLSTMMFVIIGITMMYSAFVNLLHFNKIREINSNNNLKITNAELVGGVLKNSFLMQSIMSLFILLLSIALMVIRNAVTLEIGVGLIIMVVVVLYTSFTIVPSIWALTYNKEKDKKLQYRLEKSKESSNNDNITV